MNMKFDRKALKKAKERINESRKIFLPFTSMTVSQSMCKLTDTCC